MYYVYMLQSLEYPDQRYIGYTHDLKLRLRYHNNGSSIHTAKYKPWKLLTYIAFSEQESAVQFEKYLKSGSGRAFVQRHFL